MAMLSAPVLNPPLYDVTNVAPASPPPPPATQQIPVKNLISEECIQRGDELPEESKNQGLITGQKISITSFPTDADPFIQLPEQYRSCVEYYNYQRPLDLFRFYSDRYWNILSAYGAYSNTGQAQYLPIKYYTIKDPKDPSEIKWRDGNILPSSGVTLYSTVDTNIIGLHILEKIQITANSNYFEGSGRPDIPVSTQEEAEELFEGVVVVEVPGVEQYIKDKEIVDMLTQEDLKRQAKEEEERTGTDPTVDFSENPDYSGGYTDIPEDQKAPTNTGGKAPTGWSPFSAPVDDDDSGGSSGGFYG